MTKSAEDGTHENALEDAVVGDSQVPSGHAWGLDRVSMLVLTLGLLFSCAAFGVGILGTVNVARRSIPTIVAQWATAAEGLDRAANLARQTDEAIATELTEAARPPQIRTETSSAALSQAEPPGDWRLVLSDSFEFNENDWPIFSDSNRFTSHKTQILDGNYRWEARAHQDFVWYVYPSSLQTDDFLTSVEVRKAEGSSGASYGLVFRVNDNSFYRFAISGLQIVSVERHASGRLAQIISRRVSTEIRENDVNLLAIASSGSSFSLFINGEQVGEFEFGNNRLESGFVGLTIGLQTVGESAVIEFDNFELWAPP